MATGKSAMDMEARAPSTFSLKVTSSKVFGPWLYADFISALNEVCVNKTIESHSEDGNCGRKDNCYSLHDQTLSVILSVNSFHS